ncbi:hypothetical protein LINPERPRIM_LOCUS38289 [Linum perenne]
MPTRGRFARVCLVFNLDEPLMSLVGIEGNWFKVEYEGISNICLECGCARHTSDACFKLVNSK